MTLHFKLSFVVFSCIIREIVMYEFTKRMPMLHQISSGLQAFGILDAIKKRPKLLEPVFTKSPFFKPNADTFIDNMVGSFSEDGSNDKLAEIDVYKYFTDFIEDCECSGKYIINKNMQLIKHKKCKYSLSKIIDLFLFVIL